LRSVCTWGHETGFESRIDLIMKIAIRSLIAKQAPLHSCVVMCTRENGNEAGESPG